MLSSEVQYNCGYMYRDTRAPLEIFSNTLMDKLSELLLVSQRHPSPCTEHSHSLRDPIKFLEHSFKDVKSYPEGAKLLIHRALLKDDPRACLSQILSYYALTRTGNILLVASNDFQDDAQHLFHSYLATTSSSYLLGLVTDLFWTFASKCHVPTREYLTPDIHCYLVSDVEQRRLISDVMAVISMKNRMSRIDRTNWTGFYQKNAEIVRTVVDHVVAGTFNFGANTQPKNLRHSLATRQILQNAFSRLPEDIKIVAQGATVRGNSELLSIAWEYFEHFLAYSKSTGQHPSVAKPLRLDLSTRLNPSALPKLIEYFYTGCYTKFDRYIEAKYILAHGEELRLLGPNRAPLSEHLALYNHIRARESTVNLVGTDSLFGLVLAEETKDVELRSRCIQQLRQLWTSISPTPEAKWAEQNHRAVFADATFDILFST